MEMLDLAATMCERLGSERTSQCGNVQGKQSPAGSIGRMDARPSASGPSQANRWGTSRERDTAPRGPTEPQQGRVKLG